MEYLCKKIDDRIDFLKQYSISFLSFFNDIENYNPVIIGGFIRDSINDEKSRDIDIILNCYDSSVTEKLIAEHNLRYQKNCFNGYKILINNIVIDIWNINNHNLFEKGIYEKEFKNLKETTFINYDSLVYDLKNKKLDIKYYLEFLSSNTINFVGSRKAIDNNQQKYLSIVKIFSICYNKNVMLSPDVQTYIYDNYFKNKDNFILELKKEYLRHYAYPMPSGLENYIISFLTYDKNKSLIKRS